MCCMCLCVSQVRDEQAEAQSVASVVSAEEAEVAAQAAKCKALMDDAAADLVGGQQPAGFGVVLLTLLQLLQR